MAPLAYARLPKRVEHNSVAPSKKTAPAINMAFELNGLRPAVRRSGPSYAKKLTRNPTRKSRAWPALMIERSTRIFGDIPMDNDLQSHEFDVPRSGYFFEKSEVEISPIDQVFREKRYSLKAFFDDLSRNIFSPRGGRFRRDTTDKIDEKEEVADLDQAENESRLLAILGRNRRSADETGTGDTRKDNFGHRSKRQVSEEGQEEGEGVAREEVPEQRITKTRKPGYTPVLKECNNTAASEISDLNAPPPPPERRLTLQEYSRNGGQMPKDIDLQRKKNRPIINGDENEDYEIPSSGSPAVDEEDVVNSPKEAASTTKNTQNATYINLQDHQKGTKEENVPKDSNGYPLDIPPYNPDVIPYVDVPDYSDQREESLDKDDRRVAKEKYVEYSDEDADVIDPGVSLNSDKRSEKIIVRDDDVVESDEVAEEPDNSKSRDPVEANEEEDEKDGSPHVSSENYNADEGKDGSPHVSSENYNADEEKETEETRPEDTTNNENDNLQDFDPIQFDINEYKKPFNLEELFQEIAKEAEKAEQKNKTKGDVNEHQGSKNIPVTSSASEESASDGDFKLLRLEDLPGSKASSENRETDKRSSPQDANVVPPNFFEEFDRVFGPATSETPFTGYFDNENEKEGLSESSTSVENEDGKHPYQFEDTYERLFGTENEADKSQTSKDGDEDTEYKQDATDDSTGFNEKTSLKELTDESLREKYKPLATILDKKDDISRLDDEVALKAKMEGKMPAEYKNYWTLEYGTPLEQEKT